MDRRGAAPRGDVLEAREVVEDPPRMVRELDGAAGLDSERQLGGGGVARPGDGQDEPGAGAPAAAEDRQVRGPLGGFERGAARGGEVLRQPTLEPHRQLRGRGLRVPLEGAEVAGAVVSGEGEIVHGALALQATCRGAAE
jgi:hypothetical protein